MNGSQEDQGDCETCLYFDAEDQACWRSLTETHSYDSCPDWKEKDHAAAG